MTQKVAVVGSVSRFLLNLYSSDIGGLTFEGEFANYDAAFGVVKNWVPDGNDDPERVEAERVSGMWLIEEEIGPRMSYSVACMAIYRDGDHRVTEKEEKIHPSYKPILFKSFRTRSEAETRMAHAIRKAEEDSAYDLKYRYRQDVEASDKMKAAGLSYVDPVPHFPIKFFTKKIETSMHPDTTIEEMKALQWPEPKFTGLSERREFTVTSGALRATDPCYNMDTWCAGTVEQVANGKWFAQVGHCFDESDVSMRKKWFSEELEKYEQQIAKDMADETLDDKAKGLMTDFLKRDLLKYGNPMNMYQRVSLVHIRHESVPADEPIDPSKFTKSDIHVGVDSGQAGLFDLSRFEKVAALKDHGEDKIKDHPHHAFYRQCCDATCESDGNWGVIQDLGPVSSTGWGDGGYDLFLRRNEAGEVIEARITYLLPGNDGFIQGEDEEEDEE